MALILRGLWGVSPSPKKSSPKSPPAKSPKTQSSCPKGDPYYEESRSVWRALEKKTCIPKMAVFVVVHPKNEGKMESVIEKKQKKPEGKQKSHGPISTAIVTTRDNLQDKINALPENFTRVCVLVSSGIESITYAISSAVKEVYVAPHKPDGQLNKLRIDSSSTFCDVKTYAWQQREKAFDRKLEHAEGCYFDFSDAMGEAEKLLQPRIAPEMSDDALSEQFSSLSTQLMNLERDRTPESQRQVSVEAQHSSSPGADGADSWFNKSKGILATLVGLLCGAGAGAATGGFVISSGGIVLSGPLGFALSTKFFCAAGFGAACGTAVVTTVVAGAAVYLIPWGTLWGYVKGLLWSIWSRVGDALRSVWERLKAVVMAFVSRVTACFPSFSVSGPRVHSN